MHFPVIFAAFSFLTLGYSYVIDPTFLNCVREHNKYRVYHASPKIRYDQTLTYFALKRVKFLAITDIFAHPKNLPYGENLYQSSYATATCKDAVDLWYLDEEKKFDYDRGGFDTKTGHFTQVVWRSTRYVGCARAKSSNTGYFYIACAYFPLGNYDDQYRTNVRKPIQRRIMLQKRSYRSFPYRIPLALNETSMN